MSVSVGVGGVARGERSPSMIIPSTTEGILDDGCPACELLPPAGEAGPEPSASMPVGPFLRDLSFFVSL